MSPLVVHISGPLPLVVFTRIEVSPWRRRNGGLGVYQKNYVVAGVLPNTGTEVLVCFCRLPDAMIVNDSGRITFPRNALKALRQLPLVLPSKPPST